MDLYRKAHYDLELIKSLLQNAETRFITRRSRKEAYELGYPSVDDMIQRVLKIKSDEIDKTMTSDADSSLWQDVYKTYDDDCLLYIKLQISHDGDGVIISFHQA